MGAFRIIASQFFEEFVAKVIRHTAFFLCDNGPIVFFSGCVVPGRGVEAHTWPNFSFLQVFVDSLQNLIEILALIVVDHGLYIEVYLVGVLSVEVVKVIRPGNLIFNLLSQHKTGFVRPAASYVLDGITATSQKHHRRPKALHEGEQLSVAFDRQVEVTQLVSGERVCAALDDHDVRHVEGANSAHDLLEELQEGGVIHALLERYVGGIEFTYAFSYFVKCASPREEILFELVEADSEDAIGMEKCLFYSVPMMHVNVQVENARVCLQQLQNAEHYIVDVAEATCF